MHKLLLAALAACMWLLTPERAAAQAELRAAAEGGPAASLPVVGESLRVRIDQQHATTELVQTFENRSEQRVEGQYSLRAGEGATVSGFAYYIGEQRIVGQVFEKETARAVYEDVTGLGRDPGLLEQVGEGAFSFRVFPIEPRERKRIELTLNAYLKRDGRTVTYRMPLARSGASIQLSLRDPRRIANVFSSTHRLTLERKAPGDVRVLAKPRGTPKEFVLKYRVADQPYDVATAVHRDPGHAAYVWVSLAAPEIERAGGEPKDVTLVIDRSGSMSGEPLAQARAAAARIVQQLEARDRVNVIAFDDGVEQLFDKPKPLRGAVRQQAVDYVNALFDGGGTDIAKALKHSLSSQHGGDRPSYVLFITDGQSDSAAALAAAEADRLDTRVFTIGVGAGVEKPLLARLAALKRGSFTYIESPAAIGERVGALYEKLARPVMTDVRVRFEGVQATRLYPKRLPDLFLHDELGIAARMRGTGPAKVVIEGKVGGELRRIETSFAIPKQVRRAWVGRRWAMARVDDLLEEIALHGEQDELKNEAIELALAYDLTTRYTSFLAIPESELTDSARETLAGAREQKRQLLAKHQDAAQLSRTHMPPGDPVLSVRAPASSRHVVAYFPFGLVQDLEYDPESERWTTRFLVPKDVADGAYTVRVIIVAADGSLATTDVEYVIDSREPGFDVQLELEGERVRVTVTTEELAREVRLLLADGSVLSLVPLDPKARRGTLWSGALPAGSVRFRVIATDLARNEAVRDVVLSASIGQGPAAAAQPQAGR